MSVQEFGPLRSRASRKPWPECPDIVIYRCNQCARLYQRLGYEEPAQELVCCGIPMELLRPHRPEDMLPDIDVDYKIVGGFNQNAVQVFWKTKLAEDNPEWILLRTFTGSYIRYLTAKKIAPMVFPLADEDAYVYCDNDVCRRCVFRCKRGFILYVYFKSKGLLEIPLDRIAEYFDVQEQH